MGNIIYSILILATAITAIVYGFRRGLTGQLASLLGFAFGAVCAQVFTPEYAHHFASLAEKFTEPRFNAFVCNILCASTIYFIVYFVFSILSGLLRAALAVLPVGMFNRIVGAFFSLTANLLWLSIFLNILICIYPDSGLMNYEKSDDGNMVATVMDLSPAILGCYGAEDFAHQMQLKDASVIS